LIDFAILVPLSINLFIISNPIGNSPAVLAMIKDFPLERQKKIMIREGLIALFIAFFAQFFGEWFLSLLGLKQYAVALCGGILLFLVAISLLFPKPQENVKELKKEPFVVPIATPLLTGPSMIAIIMLKSQEISGFATLSLSLLIAWCGVMPVLLFTPYLQKALGKRGVIALEQFMGMILTMLSLEMILKGIQLYVLNP
jgi:multiple antibiotic resistance protein